MINFTTAEQYCSRVFDGTHDTPKPSAEGHPLITSKNIKNGTIDYSGSYLISEEEYRSVQKRSYVSKWDVLFSMIGTVGDAYIEQSSDIPYAVKNVGVFSCLDRDRAYWLYYYLKSPAAKKHIERHQSGAVQKFLSLGALRNFPIPEFSIEKASIAKVLATLDAKIALNNRINAELEAMAKLLYDYWFVQFDFPMTAAQAAALGQAQLEGQPYKSSGGKMVFDPMLKREIPEGWENGTAASLFEFNPTESLKEKEAKHFDMACLRTSGFMTDAPFLKKVSGGPKFHKGDVVVARITPCLENGKTGLITRLDDDEIGFGSTEFIVMRGRQQSLSSFGVCLARSEYFRKFAILNMTGTSGRKRIEAPILETISIPIPNKDLLKKFEATTTPMLEQMTSNEIQNQELTTLRDWLLPMLMNGQMTVKD